MKKKILSLVMSFCVCLCSLFSLAGCSLVKEDTTIKNQKEVMRVGDVKLTRADVINSFYTYYQNNNSYFSYYDEETIVESFYTWSVIKEIVKEKSDEALYNPETNQNGFIVYTEEDAKDVKEALFEYIYSQVSTYEKAIYEFNEVEEKDYPVWLRSEEKEEKTATSFESYVSSKPKTEDIKLHDKSKYVAKLSESQVKDFEDDLKAYLFEYVSEKAENDDEEDVRSEMNAEQSEIRNQAYAKYIEGLVSNAKAAGKSTDETEVFLSEVVRVYEAYYESQVSSLFQKYWVENYLLGENAVDLDGDGVVDYEKDALSDKEIVKAYLEEYFTDMQLYQVEDSYIATMNSEDGASLVLYNYNGRNYFFTVQHILVKYDDYMTEEVSKLPGYSAGSSDYDEMIHQNYVKERDKLTNAYSMMTTINKDNAARFDEHGEIKVIGNYYYYDEEFAGDKDNNYGYIALDTTKLNDKVVYTRSDNDEEVDEADVLFLASETDILNAYETNLNKWVTLATDYIAANNDATRKTMVESNPEIEYVLETALDMSGHGKSVDEIKDKLASLLFVELQWIYSTDSLGNELSNKMGYVVSNYEDENGSWVVDFAVGARKIMKAIEEGSAEISDLNDTNVVISNYGYHIIKVDNVFASGESLVDMDSLENEIDLEDADFIAEMVELLEETYVCSASNQTLYDYYYDTLYSELVGTSESSGSYFLALQYKWLAEYNDADDIEYYDQMTYDELMEAIN